jgi:hypothetical protein
MVFSTGGAESTALDAYAIPLVQYTQYKVNKSKVNI